MPLAMQHTWLDVVNERISICMLFSSDYDDGIIIAQKLIMYCVLETIKLCK